MKTAFIFPGQGSQQIGMGQALAEAFPTARAVFDEVDTALGQDLSGLMAHGPLEELTLTENAQPAIMAVSLAMIRVLEAEKGLDLSTAAAFVAGHSLGEYSALAAAGAFTLSDCARLLKLRGQAMQSATPVGTGAMAALLGLEFEAAREIAAAAAEDQICQAANDNAPGQVVVSGDQAAVERAIALAKEKGAKRAMLLPVSAPFHCALMAPAAQAMAAALDEVAMRAPCVPVYANVSVQPLQSPDEIRDSLVAQVTGTVRWRESIAAMAEAGVDRFIEVGAGKVLTGMTKRIAKQAQGLAMGTPDDLAGIDGF